MSPAFHLALRTTAALVLFASPGLARAQGAPVLPGYWESSEAYSVLLAGSSHGRKCLTEAQVNDFITAPQTSHYRCAYASRQVGDGRASFRNGACFSRKGRKVLSDVQVDGRYAPESFHLAFHFKLMVSAGGLGLPGSAEIDAHRISVECPAEPSTTR